MYSIIEFVTFKTSSQNLNFPVSHHQEEWQNILESTTIFGYQAVFQLPGNGPPEGKLPQAGETVSFR